ncbi:hypothetical protein [Bradyrhizobium retamae]|uniref:Uncharacterized protein n=1 Tax=Bradyrhizobium retamae TaxID=1300035 RepID=A0A0R3N889_9BRAD|nr:hypothetical protein [Bradyrhizobium retamae]KRR28601.1 hypothetical protein CQ13_20230 [Bradyrhizobium retamae]
MRHNAIVIRFVLLMALMASPAGAHSSKGPHGGRFVDAKPYHAELVTKGDIVEIFISDADEKPMNAAGFRGVAIFQVSGKVERIELRLSESGALAGKAGEALPEAVKGAVQLTGPDGKTTIARFE